MPHLGQQVRTRSYGPVNANITTSTATSDIIWDHWVGESMTAATTATITTQIWTVWNHQHQTGTITTAAPSFTVQGNTTNGTLDIVWTTWNEQYIRQVPHAARVNRPRSDAEVQADLRRAEEYRIQQAAIKAEEDAATARAERLLQDSLDEKQRLELSQKGFFELDVISRNGDRRRYQIHRGWSQNIRQVDPGSGRRLKTLCIHPRERTPIADSMLAQKLMLEGGMEDELLRIANHS